jgi:DNA polymerase III delta subunit
LSVHVIIGEDDCLVSEAARKAFVGAVEIIDSVSSTNAEQQLSDIRRADASFSTPPFLEPQKTTWWKNVHFLPGARSSEEVKKALEKFADKIASSASSMPEGQNFIISGPHLLKTSVFSKKLSTVAQMALFASGKPWEMRRMAVQRAEEYAKEVNLSFQMGAAEKFISLVGIDTRSIISEIAKMREYLGEKAKVISSADIDDITSPGARNEPEIWSVTDAIGSRDASAALAAIKKFELENGFAVFMSGVIEKFFRQLIDIKTKGTEGLNPFVARKNEGFLKNWSLMELRVARARFLALREKVVSGTEAGDVLVVTELLRAISKRS